MTDTTDHLPATPCPHCGVELRGPILTRTTEGAKPDGPLWKHTPLERLTALAADLNVIVQDAPTADTAPLDLAGVITVGHIDTGDPRAIVFLAEDLGPDTRTDVLAYAIALLAAYADDIAARSDGILAITKIRRPPENHGPAHLAHHLLWTCGRLAPSAGFRVTDLSTDGMATKHNGHKETE